MDSPNYWGFRINWRNKNAFKFLNDEIKEGRLRQGWGFDESQDLRKNPKDKGSRANKPILQKVRKGDFLLIPHVPSYPYVTIVQAAQDFSKGYQFQIDPEQKDYGHIFPIEKTNVKFARGNVNVHADIRNSLRNPMRFWRMTQYGEKIQNILGLSEEELVKPAYYDDLALDNLREAINLTLNEDVLQKNIRELFEKNFQSAEWEFALRAAFNILFPNYIVERVGGKEEKNHGCDLAVFIPGLEKNRGYVIGIQVKDYQNQVSNEIIEQIMRANIYNWDKKDTEYELIDKYLIIIDAEPQKNQKLISDAKGKDIHVLFRDDVLKLLMRAAKIQMANNNQ